MSKPIFIETARLLIWDFVFADWPAVHDYGSDPEVCKYQPWGPNSEEDSRAFVQMAVSQQSETPRNSFGMAIVEKNRQRVVGAVGLRIKSLVNRDADIGYTLRQDCWGQGFGTEAALAIVEFGFDVLKMHRIWATADPKNRDSIRVLEKLGMKREGLLRSNLLLRGLWRDSVLYAILDYEHKSISSTASRTL